MWGKGLKTHIKYLTSIRAASLHSILLEIRMNTAAPNNELFEIKTILIPFDQFYAILIKNRDFKLKMAKNRPNVVCLVPTPLRI